MSNLSYIKAPLDLEPVKIKEPLYTPLPLDSLFTTLAMSLLQIYFSLLPLSLS
jgi:hypothetical protein